ncbi:hypothetical protein GCM10023196_077610 [Actinoallomurus vinaceus]|uniref:Uncharacterized protein n=1 Tax=Actinoallomurus vinaceus TaxID=1080074 RepID=A0ABP8UND5_9ACTN
MSLLRAAGSHRKPSHWWNRLGVLQALVAAWTFAIVGLDWGGAIAGVMIFVIAVSRLRISAVDRR